MYCTHSGHLKWMVSSGPVHTGEVILFMHLPGTEVLRVLGRVWRHCTSKLISNPPVHLHVPGFYQLWSLPLDLEFDCPWVTVTF